MAQSVEYLIRLRDRFSPTLRKMNSSLDKFSNKTKAISKNLGDFGKKMTTRFSIPVAAGFGLVLRNASKLETMRTAFLGILGDAEKAAKMVGVLNEFTAKTPFQLEQVASAAKQLLAAGIGPEKVSDKLQFLGDIASAANIPLSDMSSIFSKIKNKGKAMTEEILQLSDRGIPIIRVLANQFGVTEKAIFDAASQGKISFSIIENAMKGMTKKGGFANKAMINQSKTLNGLLSTMKDNFVLTSASIGDEFLPEAKALANRVIEILQKSSAWIKNNRELVKTIGKVALVFATFGPALVILSGIVLIASKIAGSFMLILPVLKLVTGGLIATFGWIPLAIAGIIAAVVLLEKKFQVFSKSIKYVIEGYKKVKSIGVGGAMDKIKSKLGFSSPNQNKQQQQKVDVGGTLGLSLDKGLLLNSFKPSNPDLGLNVALP